MSFTHTIIYLGNPPAGQRMAQALQAVAGLSPQHYAANKNEDPAEAHPTAYGLSETAEGSDPASEFAYLYQRLAQAEKVFWEK